MSWILWGKHLSIEWRTGTGFDIEFCDSMAVWAYNAVTGETEAMPFMGCIIRLPCVIISYGNVYTITEDDSE
jgi:hypothetical protein